MSMSIDLTFKHYATITKRTSNAMDDLTDSLKEMSYDVRDGFSVDAAIQKAKDTVDSVIKELSVLRDLMDADLPKKEV